MLFFFLPLPIEKVILCKTAFELNYPLILGQQSVFTFQLSQLKIWVTDQPSTPLLSYIMWWFGNDDEDNWDISWVKQQHHKLKALLAICNVFSLPHFCALISEMLLLLEGEEKKKKKHLFLCRSFCLNCWLSSLQSPGLPEMKTWKSSALNWVWQCTLSRVL